MPDDSSTQWLARLRKGTAKRLVSSSTRSHSVWWPWRKRGWNPALQRKVDPEDVVQSVFQSFFRRQSAGELELIDPASIWGLLALITIRKCGHRVEYFRAARRNISAEQSACLNSDESHAAYEAISREPLPSQAAILAERMQELMESLDEREKTILRLCLDGVSHPEISRQVGRSERTVQRVLERIRLELEAECV